jgi:hypothetical protein
MNKLDFEKLHSFALLGLGLAFIGGLIVSSFNGGAVEPALKVWLLSGSMYIPFHVMRAEQKGFLHIPGHFADGDFSKDKNLFQFRVAQLLCLIFSLVVFVSVLLSII